MWSFLFIDPAQAKVIQGRKIEILLQFFLTGIILIIFYYFNVV